MTKELDEIMRRCQAVGLRCEYDGSCLIVDLPGTGGIYICEGGQDRWVLEEVEQPFEEFETLKGFPVATWSSSQQMIECNLVELDPEMRMSVALGWQAQHADYETQFEKLQEEARRRLAGEEANMEWDKLQSNEDRRLERICEILSRLAFAQNRSEYAEAHADPKRRILIDSNIELAISIGLSSNIHVLMHEEGSWASEAGRFLTLQIRGAKVKTQQEAADLLDKVADSVLFAIDEAIEIPLALERWSRRTTYSRDESFPVAPVDTEYDSEAMSLYWSARAASSMPLIQFLAYYQVIEFYFDRYWKKAIWKEMRKVLEHPRFDPDNDTDIGRLFRAANVNPNPKDRALRPSERARLKATIQECVTLYDLRSFIVDSENRQKFFGSNRAKRISRRTISIGDMSSYSLDHREEAADRLSDIRNRIVHAREGQEPLLPSAPEIDDLRHDIDLAAFLARKVLAASSRPLRI